MELSYETGFEAYSNGSLNLEESIRNIEKSLIDRNPEKYSGFLKGLKRIKTLLKLVRVPDYEERIELLKYMYYALRLFDDICDGDLEDITLENRKNIIDGVINNGLYDHLIEKVREIAKKLGVLEGIDYSISQIVESIKFDMNRIVDTDKLRKKQDLDKNFHLMDIEGTVFGTAIIFGLDPQSAMEVLGGLGEASRKSYNIDDLIIDIKEGLINIPIEELDKFGITKKDLDDIKKGELSGNVLKWIEGQIMEIEDLLSAYEKNFSALNIFKSKGINLSFQASFLKKLFYNLVIKTFVIPKGYTREIKKVILNYSLKLGKVLKPSN